MKKIVKKLIDNSLKGVDVYTLEKSVWFIFTETRQWVFELSGSGTLWYNYYFFKNLFNYLSLDVVESQEYITKYVEDILQNVVKNIKIVHLHKHNYVEDVLQNGMKNTIAVQSSLINSEVENVLQNGVKDTYVVLDTDEEEIENVLQNGIKDTMDLPIKRLPKVEDVIKNGQKIEK